MFNNRIPRPAIVLTTARPQHLLSPEGQKRQIDSIESFKQVAKRVCFTNRNEDLVGILPPEGVVVNLVKEEHPTVKSMLEVIKNLNDEDIVILCHCDLILNPRLASVSRTVKDYGMTRIWAGVTTTITDGTDTNRIECFIGTARAFKTVYEKIPDFLRMGDGMWGDWINSWFRNNVPTGRYFDFSRWRMVAHYNNPTPQEPRFYHTREQLESLSTQSMFNHGLPHKTLNFR